MNPISIVSGQVTDTTGVPGVTVTGDTLLPKDTLSTSGTRLQSRIEYKAADSIRMDFTAKRAELYGNRSNATVKYQQIEQSSGYIEFNFSTSILYARGFSDTSGIINEPVFTEGERIFNAREMYYNLRTKQGFIRHVVTNEGEGYILGDSIKKQANDHINISSGSYTTCNQHDHPHYDIYFKKAKVIPKDKIITGPAILRIEGIPTVLFVPFGFFPNKKGQSSGVLIPGYGEAANRGFFLENGGYYFALNDYIDLALRGDIYSRGSWGLKAESVYKVRYRYTGRVSASYAITKLGDRDSPDYESKRNIFVKWNHSQEPGAHPTRRFSANVNVGSSDYNTYNPTTTNDYLTNTYSSNISYSTQLGSMFNMNAAMTHSQNTLTGEFQVKLPDVSISTIQRIYPFRRKNLSGKARWYEEINLSYTFLAQNSLLTYDSLLKYTQLKDFNNGFQHSIPLQSNLNIGGWLNINNSLQYVERWYLRTYDKSWNSGQLIQGEDTLIGYVDTDTMYGFRAARNYSFTSSWNTRLYGFYDFTKGPVTTLRHVMTPSLSFAYTPDFAEQRWGYYRYYMSPGSNGPLLNRYSIFESLVYGSPPAGRSGRVSFSAGNNLEVKVKSKDDSLGVKKIVLIENLTFGTSYDLARDSLNWNPLNVNAYTTLFKNFKVSFTGAWDPYQVDTAGRRINAFEYNKSGKIFRRTSSELNLSFTYHLSSKETTEQLPAHTDEGTEDEIREITDNPDHYIDWTNPWSFDVKYNYQFSSVLTAKEGVREKEHIQTVGLQGDFNLTPKWKIEVETGYDFVDKSLAFTRLRIWRDLHCWDMSVDWIPTGPRKSYMMTLKVKSAVLQDLKITRKSDWRDYI